MSKLILGMFFKEILLGVFIFKIAYCNVTKNCKFEPSPAASCINYENIIKGNDDKMALLDKINSRRNKLASGAVRSFPSAEDMIKLEWNDKLAYSAQAWADQCIKQDNNEDVLDVCRHSATSKVGQNVATVYGEAPGLSPLSLVDMWYTELLNTNASILPEYTTSSDRSLSHYDYFTQLVWARSTEVGCGAVKFELSTKQLQPQDLSNIKFDISLSNQEGLKSTNANKARTVNRLVCNFAPSGNIHGQAVYTAGPVCSRCPFDGVCDSKYQALCNIFRKIPDQVEETINITTAESDVSKISSLVVNSKTVYDDNNFTFDYISHFYDFTRQPSTSQSTQSSSICKDVLAVEEFIELVKKKLSNDPTFREQILATKTAQNSIEYSISDPNVAMFVSKIYSKNVPTTTTKIPESDYVNSTLLVDLVEAVIFRSAEKIVTTEEPNESKYVEVSPVKIQAALGETKQNRDFTGHYFFPEDSTEDAITETSYTYDELGSLPVSDVVLEIESMRRDQTTRDFLEDIIEADSVTEITLAGYNKRRKRNNFKLNRSHTISPIEIKTENIFKRSATPCADKILVNYFDLLKKLAMDLKFLKLNERFHCSKNCSFTFNVCFVILLIYITTLIFIY